MRKTAFLLSLLFTISFLTVHCTQQSQPQPQPSQDTDSQQLEAEPCGNGKCVVPILFPLTPLKIVGLVLIVILGGLANSTGIGGGVILTPILLIFFSYNENNAIAIVYSLIFGAALGNFINVARRRDPKTGRPLIDYELGLLCMPLMILGTNIGVIFGRIAAPVVIVLGILAVTIYNFIKIYKKARVQYREETKQIEAENRLIDDEGVRELRLERQETGLVWAELNPTEEEEAQDPRLEKVLREEDKLFPEMKIAILSGLMLIVMLLAIMRGTKRSPSMVGIPYCGLGYWIVFAVALLVCLLFAYLSQRLLKRDIRIKKEHNVAETKEGFHLAETHLKKLTLLSLIAGVLAGLLGIGGGTILSPTFLSIGVPAQTLAATAGFFIIQTSFISLFQSTLYGDVLLYEQAFFFGVAVVGSFGVSLFLGWLVKKYKRSSLLLFLLLGVVLVSIVVTPTFEIWNNAHDLGRMVQFNPIC